MLAGSGGKVRAEAELSALVLFGIDIYMTAHDDAKSFKLDDQA